MWLLKLGVLLFFACTCSASVGDVERIEEEGYYRREHSLAQPYHGKPSGRCVSLPPGPHPQCISMHAGNGMDVPFWTFGGNTVISSNYVRLTPDRQSKSGFLWNTYVSLEGIHDGVCS